MPSNHPSEPNHASRTARITLIVAVCIAVIAVGLSLWKQVPVGSTNQPEAADAAQPDVDSMISSLEAKLKADPKNADGWRMLGWAFFESGKYAESATAYARATQIDPTKPDYWSSLGEARVLAGPGEVTPDAKTAFEKAVTLDPKDPRSRYFLAVSKDMAGDHRGAINDWLSLLRDTPPGAPWEADVRKIITEVGAKEQIEVASKLASITLAPSTGGADVATAAIPGPSPTQMRSASQLPKGQQDAMIQSMVDGLEAKLKTNPANVNGWIMLMRSRMQLGQTVKARAALASARAANANNAPGLTAIDEAAAELGVSGG
ncbi:MAG: tetratricopeptide repeat protein [Sphingomonadaceae bacterium]